jgi:hypothetical protein
MARAPHRVGVAFSEGPKLLPFYENLAKWQLLPLYTPISCQSLLPFYRKHAQFCHSAGVKFEVGVRTEARAKAAWAMAAAMAVAMAAAARVMAAAAKTAKAAWARVEASSAAAARAAAAVAKEAGAAVGRAMAEARGLLPFYANLVPCTLLPSYAKMPSLLPYPHHMEPPSLARTRDGPSLDGRGTTGRTEDLLETKRGISKATRNYRYKKKSPSPSRPAVWMSLRSSRESADSARPDLDKTNSWSRRSS